MPKSANENENVIDPEVFVATTLDDISRKLSNLLTILSDQLPLGEVLNIPNGLSITGDTYIYFDRGLVIYPDHTSRDIPSYRRALFSISIENEGPDDCTVIINPEKTWGKRTINSGETYELDMKKAVIKEIKLSVAAGETCTVQFSGVV